MTELLFEETDFRSTWLVVRWKGSKPMGPIKCSQSHVVLIESCRKDGKDLMKDRAIAHDTMSGKGKYSTHFPSYNTWELSNCLQYQHVFFFFFNLPKQHCALQCTILKWFSCTDLRFLRLESYLRHSFIEDCKLPTSLALALTGLLTLLASSMPPAWPHVPANTNAGCRVAQPGCSAQGPSGTGKSSCLSNSFSAARQSKQVWQHRKVIRVKISWLIQAATPMFPQWLNHLNAAHL